MKTLIAASLATLGVAAPAMAETKLKLSHYLPAVHGIQTDFIEPWTKQVSDCSGGEVSFEIFPGGTQKGNVAKQQEQVMAGVVDIAHGLSGIPRGRFNRTSLVEMPFLTRDAGAATYALWSLYNSGDLGDEYKGLKVLALHAHNGGLLHTNGKQVEKMEDMKGLRIRTPSPPVSEMLTFLGATPQGLPPGEVYENLQRKVIDGTVFPWDPVKSFWLNEVLTDHLDMGAYTVSFFFVMNQARFDSLSEADRAAIEKVSGEALAHLAGKAWDTADAAGLAALEGKVAFHDATEAEIATFKTDADAIYDRVRQNYAAKGVDFDAALALFQSELTKVQP